MKDKLANLQETFLDYLFPKTCFGCGKYGSNLCKRCSKKFKARKVQRCPICNIPSTYGTVCSSCSRKTHLQNTYVIFENSIILDKIIYSIKYEFYYSYVKEIINLTVNDKDNNLASFLASYKPIITSVPLSNKRYRWRGFNHSEIMAKELANTFNLPYLNILRRIKNTKPQVGLGRKERALNVKDAFSLLNSPPLNSNVLIVDDVTTTGATLNECAKAIKKDLSNKVFSVVLSKGT